MARPFVFPDPKDRSVNSPTTIISSAQVLGNYNQEHPDNKRERVTDVVKEWFQEQAKEEGWSESEFHGSDCLLVADVKLGK